MLSRRQVLIAGALASLAGPVRLALAGAATEKRLVVVVLRGGLDSLDVLVPWRDPAYRRARGERALAEADLVELDRDFALSRALAGLLPLWQAGELALLPACAPPYRERSHFDAQDMLETGAGAPHALASGWLNRSLAALPGAQAMALGSGLPLLLRGPNRTESWSPSRLPEVDPEFVRQVAALYQDDPLLAGRLDPDPQAPDMAGGRGPGAFVALARQAGQFLADRARIASLELGGWDTHVNQAARLPRQLTLLADGLLALRAALGPHWQDTAVLVLTEFGRTVRGNGSGGTDHGTASLALALGGQLRGRRLLGDWPGLARLYQERDLYPTADLRGLVKTALHQHLGLPEASIDRDILPGSGGLPLYPGLFA